MVGRLENGVLDRKRGDRSTPPPQWRLELLSQKGGKEFLDIPSSSSLSARKLCATLWKIEPHQHHLPVGEMTGKYNSKHRRNKGFELPEKLIDSPYKSAHQVSASRPAIASSSRDLSHKLSKLNNRTSAELDRIWRLEEQHASGIEDNQAKIRELLEEKHSFYGKNEEQNHSKSAVESIMDELECKKKSRNRTEILHRKTAREFYELKSGLAETLKELERERKERILLENLCDEFAKGVRDYDKEVRFLKHKTEDVWLCRKTHDGLILHMSEAWLDERMQMKLGEAKNQTIINKLGFDIESFLGAKRGKKHGTLSHCSCRHSIESYQLNDAGSAPENMADEEEYNDSDSQWKEMKKRENSSRKNSSAAKKQCEAMADNPGISEISEAEEHSKNMRCEDGSKQRRMRKSTDREFENLKLSKWPGSVKENSLMAKLIEARLEGQITRSGRRGSF